MYLNLREAEAAGLVVEVTDEAISIHGSQPFPTSVDRGLEKVGDGMRLTPRERDDLRDHVADITIWSILKKLID